jgi:deoxyribonuclease V
MHITHLHRWDVAPAEAAHIQNELRACVAASPIGGRITTVAGVDVGVHDNMARAAVVLLRYPDLSVIEKVVVDMPATFPYVPGLLAFREAPAVLNAFEKLDTEPDLIIVDGQGLAHPRRFGIACHLGVVLDRPTIGCAKSRLIGVHDDLAAEAGAWVHLRDAGEVIGAVVRSKVGANPLYVSIGHKADLESAIPFVLSCCRGYRLPETTRQAHAAASQRTGLASVIERSLL